jgi:hypothetical protein
MPVRSAHLSLLVCAATFLLSACGGGDAKEFRSLGVTVEVPRDWDARVDRPSPEYVRTVHLASFRLSAGLDPRGHEAERRMKADDVYVNMAIDPGVAAKAPIRALRIDRSDLTTEWEGKVPGPAARGFSHTLVGGGSIQVWVTFGSVPDGVLLSSVNHVLATLAARPVR